jgi:hypothetical protein
MTLPKTILRITTILKIARPTHQKRMDHLMKQDPPILHQHLLPTSPLALPQKHRNNNPHFPLPLSLQSLKNTLSLFGKCCDATKRTLACFLEAEPGSAS